MRSASRFSPFQPALLTTLLAAGTLTGPTALADDIKFELGAYRWQADYDGYVQADGDRVDLNDDLGFDDDDADTIYAILEHPIPLLPNLKLQYTQIDTTANGQTPAGFEFDNVVFPAGTPVQSDLDLTHADATLYYQLLDNVVELDLGLTIRYVDGSVDIRSAGQTANEKLEVALPLLYAAGKVDLPLGFYVGADINGLAVSGDGIIDYRVNAGWVSPFMLGVEVGMRRFDIDYDDDEDQADLSIDGVYGAVTFQF